jgi:hypothetical protein
MSTPTVDIPQHICTGYGDVFGWHCFYDHGRPVAVPCPACQVTFDLHAAYDEANRARTALAAAEAEIERLTALERTIMQQEGDPRARRATA